MSCKTCRYCVPHAAPNGGTVTICIRFPPTASALLVPSPPTPGNPQGGVAVATQTSWPTVDHTMSCGEYQAKLTAAR